MLCCVLICYVLRYIFTKKNYGGMLVFVGLDKCKEVQKHLYTHCLGCMTCKKQLHLPRQVIINTQGVSTCHSHFIFASCVKLKACPLYYHR